MRKGDIRAGDNRAPNSMIEFVEGNDDFHKPDREQVFPTTVAGR